MNTKEITQKLRKEGYTLSVIARQSGIPYMRLYRHIISGAAMCEREQAAVRAFALVQPCFTRGDHE